MQTQNLTFDQLPKAVTLLLNEVQELKQMLAKVSAEPQQDTTKTQPDLITINEACEILDVSRATLWRYEKQGKIKVYGIGGKRLLKRAEVIGSLILKK